MCLYPVLGRNKKYEANAKNGGDIPAVSDVRVLYVPRGCGNCIECMKKRGREWQLRLLEDIKVNTNGKFITLTFSDESILELTEQKPTKNWPSLKGLEGYELDNEIAIRATRLWLERWRKINGKSIRHFMVTELGHEGTKNIHLHGIVWTNRGIEAVRRTWKYGYVYPRTKEERRINYVSERSVNYIIKYITKKDADNKTYKSRILTSPGIGSEYTKSFNATKNKYDGAKTETTYKTSTGHRVCLPTYWRNKLYNEKERENLWLYTLDKEERWVCGERVSANEEETYNKTVAWYRKINEELGYGTRKVDEELKRYERDRRKIMMETRLKNAKEKMEEKKWKEEQAFRKIMGL